MRNDCQGKVLFRIALLMTGPVKVEHDAAGVQDPA